MSRPVAAESSSEAPCPPSATHGGVVLAMVSAFTLATAAVYRWHPPGTERVLAAALVLAATALATFAIDLGWLAAHRRPSTGIDLAHDDPSLARTATKLLGLVASLAAIGGLYALFPEYHGRFYDDYYALLRVLVPVILVLAVPYFYFVDRHLREPRDGYWQAGRAVLGHWQEIDRALLGQHALGWLIKGFFLPLMFSYFTTDLARLMLGAPLAFPDFRAGYNFAYDFLYYVDVGLVSMGYLCAFRLTDTHLRSAEPTLSGWVVALVCYEPFWAVIGDRYFAYGSAATWGTWLGGRPLAYPLWGSLILGLTGIYVWATVSFGARFSNLTHRGIITSGPYRYVKHPAYLAKNLSWWLISVPFLVTDSWASSVRRCLLLAGVNLIYAARAATEERHLGADPVYRAYARYIDRHGLFSRGRRRAF